MAVATPAMFPVPMVALSAAGVHPRTLIWPHVMVSVLLGVAGNIQILGASLENVCQNLEAICARGDDLPVYEARFEIDRLFRDDLSRFAEARESMIHVFGMQNYADVMSNFAAGERYINRVWSASTDGYVDEVRMYLERAREQFREARRHFDELASRHA